MTALLATLTCAVRGHSWSAAYQHTERHDAGWMRYRVTTSRRGCTRCGVTS